MRISLICEAPLLKGNHEFLSSLVRRAWTEEHELWMLFFRDVLHGRGVSTTDESKKWNLGRNFVKRSRRRGRKLLIVGNTWSLCLSLSLYLSISNPSGFIVTVTVRFGWWISEKNSPIGPRRGRRRTRVKEEATEKKVQKVRQFFALFNRDCVWCVHPPHDMNYPNGWTTIKHLLFRGAILSYFFFFFFLARACVSHRTIRKD